MKNLRALITNPFFIGAILALIASLLVLARGVRADVAFVIA
jgi:hypothetical protein